MPGESLHRFPQAFRAFKHPQFRLFWFGQGVSVIGTWMQTTALGWLVYRLTDSPFVLGLLTFARFGPSLVGSPLAGVLIDRAARRSIVLATQSASLIQASVLAALTLSGRVQVWQLLALAALQGVIDTLDMPARHTLQVELVGVQDLQSAVSLNSSAFNVGRMVGPALAGWVVARVGEGTCFAINAVSYLAVLLALTRIRPTPAAPTALRRSFSDELAEGVRFAWRAREVRAVLFGVAVTSAVGLSYTTLLPVFARDVLGAGPEGYGTLLGGAGIGAVIGALAAALRPGPLGAVTVNACGQLALGCGLVGLGMTRHVAGALIWMVFVGLAVAIQLSTTNAFLQISAPPELRARVLSLYLWLFAGLSPLGGLAAGAVAERLGAPRTALGAGMVCACAAVIMLVGLRRRRL